MQTLPVLLCLFPGAGTLAAGVVHHVVPVQNQLRNGENGITLLDKILQNRGQGLRCVEGGIVEQHDASRRDSGGDPGVDRVGIVVFPIQAVPKCNKVKPLCRNGLRDFGDTLQVLDF